MQITSIAGVLEVLGGYKKVSRLCGASDHASLMWKLRGALPRRTFVVLSHELTIRGHSAPLKLWGMDPPAPARGRRKKRANGKART